MARQRLGLGRNCGLQLRGTRPAAPCTRAHPRFHAVPRLLPCPSLPAPAAAPPHADRMVLKTCGTTKLLACVPHMCQLAAGLGQAPARVKYTRASFLFPEQQPAPHTSFAAECGALRAAFGGLGSTSSYVLGDGLNGLQWHVFVAGERGARLPACCSPAAAWLAVCAWRLQGLRPRVRGCPLCLLSPACLPAWRPGGPRTCHTLRIGPDPALPAFSLAHVPALHSAPLPTPCRHRGGPPHQRATPVHSGGLHDGAGSRQGCPVLPLRGLRLRPAHHRLLGHPGTAAGRRWAARGEARGGRAGTWRRWRCRRRLPAPACQPQLAVEQQQACVYPASSPCAAACPGPHPCTAPCVPPVPQTSTTMCLSPAATP